MENDIIDWMTPVVENYIWTISGFTTGSTVQFCGDFDGTDKWETEKKRETADSNERRKSWRLFFSPTLV